MLAWILAPMADTSALACPTTTPSTPSPPALIVCGGADYRVDCDSLEYSHYKYAAWIAVMIWPLGCPLSFYFLLRSYGVPKMASTKLHRAKETVFLRFCLAKVAARGLDASLRLLWKVTMAMLHSLFFLKQVIIA